MLSTSLGKCDVADGKIWRHASAAREVRCCTPGGAYAAARPWYISCTLAGRRTTGSWLRVACSEGEPGAYRAEFNLRTAPARNQRERSATVRSLLATPPFSNAPWRYRR